MEEDIFSKLEEVLKLENLPDEEFSGNIPEYLSNFFEYIIEKFKKPELKFNSVPAANGLIGIDNQEKNRYIEFLSPNGYVVDVLKEHTEYDKKKAITVTESVFLKMLVEHEKEINLSRLENADQVDADTIERAKEILSRISKISMIETEEEKAKAKEQLGFKIWEIYMKKYKEFMTRKVNFKNNNEETTLEK